MIERFVRPARTPPHLFRPGATYFITAKTLHGEPIIDRAERRQQVIESLQFATRRSDWKLMAWVVLSNHYHCILQASPEGEAALSNLIGSVHKFTAYRWNEADGEIGRTVWYRYWDTCLTSEGSFFARLNYIHFNPVKHGVERDAAAYPFSSYSLWMESIDLPLLEAAYPWERLELE